MTDKPTGLTMKYFVLSPDKPDDDPYGVASRAAIHAYARSIRTHNVDLADDLVDWMDRLEEEKP